MKPATEVGGDYYDFVSVGEKWADGRPQNNDMTFVVLKAR